MILQQQRRKILANPPGNINIRDSHLLFSFLGLPTGNGRRRRFSLVSNLPRNQSVARGRPRRVFRRRETFCSWGI